MIAQRTILSSHLAGAAAIALATALVPGAAVAQDQPAAEEPTPANEEIIVTAQKREQRLSEVSLSVSAVGAETLQEQNIVNVEALQNLVPSISFGNDFNFAKLFIRGIGLSSSLPGVDPSVALHVDGVVVSLPQAQLGSLFDLERVEVLRGPQGTLYGRNATGGTINLITAKPSSSLEGYARFTIGGPNLLLMEEGAIGGPITDRIRARIAVQKIDRDGYGINEFTGNDIDNSDQLSARAHLELLPTDTTSLLFTGEYHRENDRSLAIKFRSLSFPGVLTDANPANDGLSSLGQRTNADGSQARFASNVRNLATNFDPINDRKQWSLTMIGTWDPIDQLQLKSLTSYRSFDSIFFHDFDMSTYLGYPLAQTSPLRTSANHWQPVFENQASQEFQANIEAGPFHGVFGAFFLKEWIRVENHIGFDVLANTDPLRVQFDGRLTVDAGALYANVTYDLSPEFSLKGGARVSAETRRLRNNSGIGSAATGFVLDPLQFDTRRNFEDFSPSAGFEWRPSGDLLVYGNWSRAFKSGTAEIGSTRRLSVNQPQPFVEPEKVEAFEVGGKYTGGTLDANLAVFYYTLKNGQFSLTRPIPTPPFFVSNLTNAASSEAYGAELEVLWRPTQAFALNASLAYLHSRFTNFFAADPLDARLFAPGAVASQLLKDLSGNPTRMSPDWSLNLNPRYEIDLGNTGTVTLASNFAYRSKQFHTEFADPRMAQEAYIMLDGNVRYETADGRWSANAFVKNITDELVWAGSFAVSTSRTIGGTLMPPRTYGVTLGYAF
ncbi:MAG: TonB-dependent receptor [Qipengyuania sp.]|nr:TonB-dependent receptor [Qipengyuania sp.]